VTGLKVAASKRSSRRFALNHALTIENRDGCKQREFSDVVWKFNLKTDRIFTNPVIFLFTDQSLRLEQDGSVGPHYTGALVDIWFDLSEGIKIRRPGSKNAYGALGIESEPRCVRQEIGINHWRRTFIGVRPIGLVGAVRLFWATLAYSGGRTIDDSLAFACPIVIVPAPGKIAGMSRKK
jgi:hypothetical protein